MAKSVLSSPKSNKSKTKTISSLCATVCSVLDTIQLCIEITHIRYDDGEHEFSSEHFQYVSTLQSKHFINQYYYTLEF